MPQNFTKRIVNTITKINNTYELTSKRVWVPAKGSKKRYHGTEVNPMKSFIKMTGTPPALKNIQELYETAMSAYYKTMHGHKGLKKKLNKVYRSQVA